MRNLILYLFLLGYCLPISLKGQNTFSISSGISESHIPIYSQKINASILSTSFSNKLTFSFGYDHRTNDNLVWSNSLSYSNLGGNALYRQLDQENPFVNSVALEYLSYRFAPKLELQYGNFILSGGVGGSVSYLINKKIENYTFVERSLKFLDSEDVDLKNIDAGLIFNIAIKRKIAKDFNLLLSLERYQGLMNISNIRSNPNEVYLSNTNLIIGLQFPIKKEKA